METLKESPSIDMAPQFHTFSLIMTLSFLEKPRAKMPKDSWIAWKNILNGAAKKYMLENPQFNLAETLPLKQKEI